MDICEGVSREHWPGREGGRLDVVVCHPTGWVPDLSEIGKRVQPECLHSSSLSLAANI